MRLRNSDDQSGRNNCCPTKHRCVSCTKKNKRNNDPPGGKKERAIKKEITWPLCYLRSRSERGKSLSSKAQKKGRERKTKNTWKNEYSMLFRYDVSCMHSVLAF